MRVTANWLLILIVWNLCTCGGRTECVNMSKLAVIANLGTKRCENNVNNHFYLQDAGDNLAKNYKFDYEGLTFEMLFLDTCGTNQETLKAVYKTIMWADIDCLHPPYFLGLIGPDSLDNLNVSQKITSALEIPHIVSIQSTTMNTHQILPSLDTLIIKGIFKIIEIFGWKSFFMQSTVENEFMRKIIHQFTIEASVRKYCFLTNKDQATHFILLGKPDENFFDDVRNASIIIINVENLEIYMRNHNSSNSFLILDNLIINWKDMDLKSEEYQLRLKKRLPFLNERKELFFVPDAIKIYVNAINSLCESKNCQINKDLKQWNKLIFDKVTSNNNEKDIDKFLTFKLKEKFKHIKSMGKITHFNNDVQIYWNNQLLGPTRSANQMAVLNDLKNFFVTSEIETYCAEIKINTEEINNEDMKNHKTATVIISDLTESEWWTMVGTVAGVGIGMFAVGFFAVYIVYINIRGPRITKGCERDLDRDSSLRRVGSDRQTSFTTGRTPRAISGLQRRDSRSSIRSNISDRSV